MALLPNNIRRSLNRLFGNQGAKLLELLLSQASDWEPPISLGTTMTTITGPTLAPGAVVTNAALLVTTAYNNAVNVTLKVGADTVATWTNVTAVGAGSNGNAATAAASFAPYQNGNTAQPLTVQIAAVGTAPTAGAGSVQVAVANPGPLP